MFVHNSRGVLLRSIFIQDTMLIETSRGVALHSILIQDTMFIERDFTGCCAT